MLSNLWVKSDQIVQVQPTSSHPINWIETETETELENREFSRERELAVHMKPIKGASLKETHKAHRTSHMAHRTATASVIKFNLFKLRQWQICVFNCLTLCRVSSCISESVSECEKHSLYCKILGLISCAEQSVDMPYIAYYILFLMIWAANNSFKF